MIDYFQKEAKTMDEIEKKAKYCKQYSIIYFVFSILAFLYYIGQGKILIFNILAAVLFIVCFIGSGKQQKYGPICGIIACIMMIATLNPIEIVLAIFLLINCINLLRSL